MTEDGVGKRDPMAKAIGPAAALVSPELLDVMNAGLDDDKVDKIGEIADPEPRVDPSCSLKDQLEGWPMVAVCFGACSGR
ncbi:hypothetical protein ACOMHN_029197 [Nucella lapillus]